MRSPRVPTGCLNPLAVIGMDRFVDFVCALKEVVNLGQFVAQDEALLRATAI
jgi:hypothetical protein